MQYPPKTFIILAGLVLLSYPAAATDGLTTVNPQANAALHPGPLEFNGIYEFSITAVRFGKMGIEVTQTPEQYAIAADIVSTGLVGKFVKHSSHTTVDGSGGREFTYPNITYESNYQTRKKKKYVKMVRKAGGAPEETLVPPDNPKKRPPVEDELKKDAADPLTFLLRMREALHQAMLEKKERFSLKLYDGRRLTQVDFAITGKEKLKYNKKKVPVIVVSVTRKLLAGFTQSELADHDPNEPVLYLYITHDSRLIPIRAEVNFWMGTVSAALVKECRTGESCLLGNKE